MKRGMLRALVLGAVRLVGLEEQRVVVDEAEEQLAAVQADAAEHAPRSARRRARELLEDVGEVLRLDGHRLRACASVPSCASSARSDFMSGAAATASKAGAWFQS